MSERPRVNVVAFLPKDFLNKTKNEPFIQKIMEVVLEHDNWSQGNADNFEPDYFCDGVPFEFTIASNRKKKENYIQKFRSGSYTTEDAEKDVIQYIQESIQNKLEKQYSVSNVHLCVLCIMNLSNWVFDEYGSRTRHLFDDVRASFFSQIKAECIETNKFRNVFIIFPDMYAKWWVWDVLTNNKASIQLSPQEILSGKYPFWIDSEPYEELLKSRSAKWNISVSDVYKIVIPIDRYGDFCIYRKITIGSKSSFGTFSLRYMTMTKRRFAVTIES